MSDWYESLFRGVLFPLYEGGLRRRKTVRHLREYERDRWLLPERIAAIQWKKLQRLLAHCWNEVPYYERRWSEAGIEPGDIRTLKDFARLPVLTKRDIRKRNDDMHARSLRGQMLFKSTSGSTGEPPRLGHTRESFERRIAVMWRGYRWAGSRIGRRTRYLWGAPVDGPTDLHRLKVGTYHRVFGRKVLNTYFTSSAHMARHADEIERFRPRVIVGYINPLVRLAQWLLKQGRKVHGPPSILGAAEALHDFQRELIERAFGFKAYNSYGMPFVRYVNGDAAVPGSATPCACGRGLPRLVGRTLDEIRAPDGRVVLGEFVPFLLNATTGVKRFSVHQRQFDRLDINLVDDAAFAAAAEQRCCEQSGSVVGEAMTLAIKWVEDLLMGPWAEDRVSMSEVA